MAEEVRSYEQLLADAQAEWRRTQAQAQAAHEELVRGLRQMPDVRDAPAIGSRYVHDDIMCPCGETEFRVTRWVTVNGTRHRAEFKCARCGSLRTWDWGTARWLS